MIHGRRKAPKTPPDVSLQEAFDAESTTDDSRTKVGSTRDTLRTEVGTTVDDDADDGDEDGCDGTNSAKIWNEEDLLDEFVETRKTRNLGVGYYYRKALGSPRRSQWHGKNETIYHICDVFKLTKTKQKIVNRILNDILIQEHLRLPYDGKEKRWRNKGRPVVTIPGSVDEGLLADWMEDNHGFHQTTIFLNQYRMEERMMPVGRSVVISAFDRMNTKINLATKQVQEESSDAWTGVHKKQTK